MRGVLYVVRTWPLRRRVALAAVVLLASVSIGLVILAGLGARRAGTAWGTLRERARGETALLDITSIDGAQQVAQASRGVSGVTHAAAVAYAYLRPEESTEGFYGGVVLPLDHSALDAIWRPVLTAGRRADPGRVDEVMVNEHFVDNVGLGVGDRLTLVDPVGLISQPVTIVGVGVLPSDFTFAVGSSIAYPTLAFSQRWEQALHELFDAGGLGVIGPGVLVTGKAGANSEELLARLSGELAGEQVTGVHDSESTAALVVDTLSLQRNGYLVLAIAGGLATLSMFALVLSRVTRLQPSEITALAALGFSRRDRSLAVAVPGAVVAAPAAAGAVMGAALTQSLVPTGLAERVGAGRGLGDDIGLIALSGLGTFAVLCALVAAVAILSTRSPGRAPALSRRWSTLLRWPSVGAGVRAATGGLSSAGRRQASAAFSAVMIATIGVLAVAVIVASRDGLRADLSRVGKFYDAGLGVYPDRESLTSDREALLASSAVTAVATIEAFTVRVDHVSVAAIAVTPDKGSMAITLVDGRLPVGDEEIVTSEPFLRRLQRRVGDSVEVLGPAGVRRFDIVGVAVLPFVAPTGIPGEQVAFAPAGREAIGGEPDGHLLVADLADPTAARQLRTGDDSIQACDAGAILPMLGVERLSGLTGGDVTLCVPRGDERISNVEELGSLPHSVIGFLTLLGVAGVAYLLSASFRRTRRDLAVLRVLGFTRRQVAATVLVQAGTVGSVGALVALPFGVAFGRAAWRGVADNVGVVVMPEVSVLGTLGVVLAAVVVAELLALPFAATAATRRSVQMLRAE